MTSAMSNAAVAPQAEPELQPLSPAEMAEVERKVSKAKSLLILDHPFFGTAVSKRPIKYTYDIPTASMQATGQMSLNPHFVKDLTVKNIQFLLAHEGMHFMLMHSLRRKHRDPKAWNVAADKVINDTLIDAGVGEFIDGGITLHDARNYAAEELYDENDQGDGNGPGGTGNDIGDATDEDGNQLDESQVHTLEAQAKIETLQSAKAAKQVGKLPAGIERLISEMLEVKTPWHEILERLMTSKVRDGVSWRRPNRRFVHQGIYLPGNDYVPKMGEIVIGVDTSGSIGEQELNEFNAHINRILDTCGPEKVHVVYCDAEVNHTDEFEPDDYPVRLTPHGGGGTSFKPVFDWVSKQSFEPEAVVYLTDGYGDQNHIDKPPYDVVWLTTHNEGFDWGQVVKFESAVE